MKEFISFLLMVMWITGFILSHSWWGIIPFYAFYVFIERAMDYYHILGYIHQ